MAADLNRDGISAPPSGKRKKGTGGWAQNTINGNRERGTGILNNDLYVGRRVWNRHDWVRHPDTGKRLARARPLEDHRIALIPHMRIVPDELWETAKARQAARWSVSIRMRHERQSG
ncbi:recombinase family protein [Rubellimicrobium aerolatum]|uniref:Recombinase family protein n=1 Tax=Rubellimicrobium aerolatum TaxID=490979 RepID=A0ABW0SHH5_9RHOB